jgi:photosystem II stability/assembly factor-like uncharacterized protein
MFFTSQQREAEPMNYTWRPTSAPVQTRYDDIWFISPQVGWGVNSAGQIVHTEDGGKTFTIQKTVGPDVWLRCMSFTSPTDGWIGSITRRQRLWKTQDGKTWTDMTPGLPAVPSAVCGICSSSKNVVYASGTQYPDREAGILKTTDGGQTWTSISMAAHANLLIDNYFVDDLHGWVVGGVGGTDYPDLQPVVLFTADGGASWENRLQNSGIVFPKGEWGWKIQFLTSQIGFVSLENDTAAAILKTSDGGRSWQRIEVKDPQKNVELEGIGFIDEKVGWVGGWGHGFMANTPDGSTSGTTDGGATPIMSAASSTGSVSSKPSRWSATPPAAPSINARPARRSRRRSQPDSPPRARCRFPMPGRPWRSRPRCRRARASWRSPSSIRGSRW